jgi:hypothetical protein
MPGTGKCPAARSVRSRDALILVQVETVLQNGQLLVTEIAVGVAEPEPEPEPEPRG